jgi:RNA polymerase sigma factor (sigma-70 family)
MDDWRLLCEYRERGSEAAFSRLVEEHMKMVYWTCRRDLTDQELAELAAQVVFVLLARKAEGFNRRISVSGWLFNASRFVARDFNKREARRRRREEAAIMQQPASDSDSEWRELEPWLNDGLSHLSESDREAILLRYFTGLSTPELASALGTTEASARKRLSRAVERLRVHFVKRGIAVTGVALGGLLAQHSAKAVPSTFHATTMAALQGSLATPAASVAHLLTWQQGANLVMQASKQKIAMVVMAIVLLSAVVVPIAGWKIYHTRAIEAEIGPGGFTDSSTPSGDTATEAARSEIVGDYKTLVDGFNAHNFSSWLTLIVPEAVITTQTGAPVTRTECIADNQRNLAAHPDGKLTASLRSLTVTGNQATGEFDVRWAETTTGQDSGGPGRLSVMNESYDMNWENRNGKWVIVKIATLSHTEQVQ